MNFCKTTYDFAVTTLAEKLSIIFVNIKNIISVNSILLTDLAKRYQNWSDKQVIGDVLSTLAPFLGMYKMYGQIYEDCVCKSASLTLIPRPQVFGMQRSIESSLYFWNGLKAIH